jgi:hypothetical protein
MRRAIRFAALTIPLLVPLIAGDAPASQVLYTGKRQQPLPLSNVGDPASVARARLFVTRDQGRTWTLAHELQIAEGAKELPRFPFSVEQDGAYGIMPCLTYRNGQSEPEPKPGQAPPYVLVVDTAAPTLMQFDAVLVGRATSKAVVRVTWSVTEANGDAEPVAIEASSDGGARFVTIHRGGLDGAQELTVPVSAEASDLQLRLLATDRARNVTVSPSRNLALAPMRANEPAAPVDPKEALAKAAATLPTLAEVGAVDPRPLPTTPIAPPSQANPTAPVAPPPGGPATTPPAAPPPPPPPAAAPPTPRAEVLVDGRPYEPPATAPGGEPAGPGLVIADNSVDQAYYEALAARRPATSPTNPKTAIRPVPPPPPPPAAPLAPPPGRDGSRAGVTGAAVFVGDEVRTLNDARVLAITGHLDDACDLYERLLFSSLGRTALEEAVRLLRAADRPRDALTLITTAPLEVRTDAVRLEHGELLLALARPQEVEAAVASVAGNGPEARPALLLIARAYLAMERLDEARRALDWLARGNDAVAVEARRLGAR